MNDRAARVMDHCRQIAQMTEEPGRTTRRFLSSPMRDVHAFLRVRMEALGMSVHVDAAGNLRGLWTPTYGPRLILGSHVDTVPDAGAFDGVLGVVMALEWVQIAQELNLPLPIEVIAFSEEEGVRFGAPFLGSCAVVDRFDPALLALKDAQGLTMEQVLRDFGLDPARLADAAIAGAIRGFVEIHIEQGPVLESENLSLAAVSAISGQTRMTLEFRGQANHAGTTPMHLRRDALAGAAEWIAAVEALALQTQDLVATVGTVGVEPNAGNVVPGTARVSLDVRHANDKFRVSAVSRLLESAEAIASRRSLQLDVKRQLDQSAVPMDERLTTYLAESIEAEGLPPKCMFSGAGHDAMVMATRMPAAMLFLRSPGGISHHPAETVREQELVAALKIASSFLSRIVSEYNF
jgi:allantoate deiminase